MDIIGAFDKIMKGEPVSEEDRHDVRMFLKKTITTNSNVGQWVPPGSDARHPFFYNMRARSASFDFFPTESIYIQMSVDQSIPNNITTTILPETIGQSGFFFGGNTATGTVQFPNGNHTIGFLGSIEWDAVPGGFRAITAEILDEAGTALFGTTMNSLLPSGATLDNKPFASGFFCPDILGSKMIRFRALQNSGGAVTINFLHAFMFVLR